MIARISSTLLLAASALWPSALSAQWGAPFEPAPGMGYAPPTQFATPSGPIQLANGYAPQPGPDYYGDGSEFVGSGYAPKPMPWERDGDSPFRSFLREVVPNTYFRVEYLSWDVDDIGAGGVGAETRLPGDPRELIPFGLFDIDTFTAQDFRVPNTEPITFNKLSGLRGTFGVPLTIGTFEVSAFALEDGEGGLLNPIPTPSMFRNFTVPLNTALTVPVGVDTVTFPIGTLPVGIPLTPNLIFNPEPIVVVPPVTEVFVTIPGDIIAPGTTILTANTSAVAIPLLQNGQPGLSALVYDVAYGASYNSEIWGAEAKLVLDIGPNHNGLTLNPLVGFRYMGFDEEFQQAGISSLANNVLRNGNTLFVSNTPTFLPINQPGVLRGPLFLSTINSEVENTLYGLQVGTRTEFNHKRFALGIEPRVSLGVNNYEAEVTTRNLRSPADGEVRTADDDLIFAPVFDVSMYGKVHVTPYFSLHAGYNFTYLFRVTRPHDNISYNDNGPTAPPGVVLDADTQDMHIQGLTVGGEFRFRDLKFR